MKKTFIAMMALAGMASATTFTMDDLLESATIGTGVVKDKTYAGCVYTFNGQGAITNISDSDAIAALSGTSGFVTIAAWVNQTEGSEDAIFSVGGQNDGFKFALKGDNLQVTTKGVKDTTTGVAVAQGTLDKPVWTLVAVTIDLDKNGSDSVFYVGADGYTSLTTSDGWALGSWNSFSTNTIAIGSGNGNGNRDLFEGQIANLTFFTSETAPTAASIQQLMGNTAPVTIPEPTTATLSLLALAGLAARRRRR